VGYLGTIRTPSQNPTNLSMDSASFNADVDLFYSNFIGLQTFFSGFEVGSVGFASTTSFFCQFWIISVFYLLVSGSTTDYYGYSLNYIIG
jgi:hypothetical protein